MFSGAGISYILKGGEMKIFYLCLVVVISLIGCGRESKVDVYTAVRTNNTAALQDYLDGGGSPDATTKEGESLLYLATGPKGGTDVLKLLLKNGADPDKGYAKYTPLMNAASWACLEICQLLVESGADPCLKNSKNLTAVQCVGNSGGSEKAVIEYLTKAMASKNADSLSKIQDSE